MLGNLISQVRVFELLIIVFFRAQPCIQQHINNHHHYVIVNSFRTSLGVDGVYWSSLWVPAGVIVVTFFIKLSVFLENLSISRILLHSNTTPQWRWWQKWENKYKKATGLKSKTKTRHLTFWQIYLLSSPNYLCQKNRSGDVIVTLISEIVVPSIAIVCDSNFLRNTYTGSQYCWGSGYLLLPEKIA